jgi:phosphoglycerate dehydrogenase-like enzyme
MEKKNVLVLFPCPDSVRENFIANFSDRCNFVFESKNYHPYLEAAHILIGEPKNDEFSLCRNLKFMQSPSSGVNYYVDGSCFPEGAILCSSTGCYGNIIAEHMLAMTLSLCRRLPEYQVQQKDHLWQKLYYDKQLEDCTVLILGAGDIGTTLAKWLRPMVKKIIGIRRNVGAFPDCYDEMRTTAQLDDHIGSADIILCALPHTAETAGLLNRERLSKIKADAVLVNGGRGSLIDQEALCDLLDAGHFYGVGLEVTNPEPLPSDHPLWNKPRCIITPPTSGNTFGPNSPLVRKIWAHMTANLAAYLDGKSLRSQADFSTGYCK